MRIIWNPQAQKDVSSIKAFYQKVDPDIARQITQGIVSSVDRLEQFPESGRIVPEIRDPDFREVIWRREWRIIYLLPAGPGEPLEILNVLHTSQQFGSL